MPVSSAAEARMDPKPFIPLAAERTVERLALPPDLAKFYADEVVARAQKMLSGIIQRGVETGEFREIDPAVAARMLMALTVMNAIWRDEHTGVPLLCHKNDEEVFRELAHFYLHSLTTAEGASAQADGAPSDVASFIPFTND